MGVNMEVLINDHLKHTEILIPNHFEYMLTEFGSIAGGTSTYKNSIMTNEIQVNGFNI